MGRRRAETLSIAAAGMSAANSPEEAAALQREREADDDRKYQALADAEPRDKSYAQAKHEFEVDAEPGDVVKAIREKTEELRKAARARAGVQPTTVAGGGLRFSVTWGREQISPAQFHMNDVGPFTVEGEILPGETYADAHARVYGELVKIAEAERERKFRSFIPHILRK